MRCGTPCMLQKSPLNEEQHDAPIDDTPSDEPTLEKPRTIVFWGRFRLQSLQKLRNRLRSIEFDKSIILMMMMMIFSFFSLLLLRTSLCGNQHKTPKNSTCREKHSGNMQDRRRHWRRRPQSTLKRRQTRSPTSKGAQQERHQNQQRLSCVCRSPCSLSGSFRP